MHKDLKKGIRAGVSGGQEFSVYPFVLFLIFYDVHLLLCFKKGCTSKKIDKVTISFKSKFTIFLSKIETIQVREYNEE